MQDQVEVIWHEAPSEQWDGDALAGLAKEFDKGIEITVFVKDRAATVASIKDVVAKTTLGSTCTAWHENILPRPKHRRKNNEKCTLSPLCALRSLSWP